MEDMVMDVDTMARGRLKLKLSQDILEDMDMVIEAMVDMDMVVMVMVVDPMARGRPKLSQAILEDMVDMDIVVMVWSWIWLLWLNNSSLIFTPTYMFIGFTS